MTTHIEPGAARWSAPRKHPVDDPPPVAPNPVAPVDEPKHHEPGRGVPEVVREKLTLIECC